MSRTVFAPAALPVALLLAACGQQSAAPPGDAGETAAAPAAVATSASGAPKRAAGLWSLKNIGGGGTVIGTQQLCVDDASEEKASVFDQIAKNINCSKYEIVPGSGSWSFEFVCGGAGMTATTKGTVGGDFASSYKVEFSESDGAMEMSRTIEASRSGDCPAGVAPGTLMDEQGNKVADITQ